jgi:putative ABC transport system permease protein
MVWFGFAFFGKIVMKTLNLALKLLKREWHAGEMRILMLALFIAIACMTSVNLFADRIEKAMFNQAADLLGGDLALTSANPVTEQWLQQAESLNIAYSRSMVFFSMLAVGDQLQLASIKAVEAPYPLRGELKIAEKPFESGVVTEQIPKSGQLWMQSNLFPLLNISPGDDVSLGDIELQANKVLAYQPDPPGRVFSLSPYAMMNLEDVERSGIVQPGSRVEYTVLFCGDKNNLLQYKVWLESQLLPGQKLINADKNRPSLQSTLERVQHYLGLGSLISVILAGVALAVALKRFTRRHYDMVALMRCYGASAKSVLLIYLWVLVGVGVLGILLGCAVGYFAQGVLEKILATFVQFDLPTASLTGLWFGAVAGFMVLFAFGMPPLWQLTRVTPLKVLRRDLEPLPMSSLWLYLSGVAVIVSLIFWYTKDFTLAMVIIFGCMVACVLFLLGSWWLIKLSGRFRKTVGVSWRYGLANLNRRWQSSILQITAFGFTLMVLLLLVVVRNDLILAWQNELPQDAPNYFVINISPEQVPAIEKQLEHSAGIRAEQIFPMIRGRLHLLNDNEILSVLSSDKKRDEIFQREVNLSLTNTMPHNNKLVSGRWFNAEDKNVISLERGLSERLGLKIGDTLGFRIGAQTVQGEVINIREVNWASLQPNFYVLFPPGVLEQFPSTYITSFFLPNDQSDAITQLVSTFPNLTVINIAETLAQIQNLLTQAGNAIQYLLVFAFLAGFVVLYASIYASLDQRLYEGGIIRALGASRAQLVAGLMAEFLTLGALAGLLGGVVANGIGIALGYFVFNLNLGFNVGLVVIGMLVGAVMIGVVGYFATRPIVRQSPIVTMRQ